MPRFFLRRGAVVNPEPARVASREAARLPRREGEWRSSRRKACAVDSASLFAQVIQEHLELKRRNAALEHEMPLEKYMNDDPFENHPLFKTEEQARVEDTMDGAQSIVDEPTSLDWPARRRTRSSTPRP